MFISLSSVLAVLSAIDRYSYFHLCVTTFSGNAISPALALSCVISVMAVIIFDVYWTRNNPTVILFDFILKIFI